MIEKIEYEICITDVLEEKWKSYFSPLELVIDRDETILHGEIHDQAELFGVLLKIRDLGLHLRSVNFHGEKLRGSFQGRMSSIMIM